VVNLHADGRLFLGTCFAQDRIGSQRFAVDFGDQKGIAAIGFLPNLTDLNFFDGHCKNVDTFAGSVNTAQAG